MNTQRKGLALFSILIILSILLAACQPGTTPTPERIVETVVVTQMVQGTPVEVVVTPTPGEMAAETEAPTTGILEADGMVACLPLPELPEEQASSGSAHLAKFTNQQSQEQPAKPEEKLRSENEAFYGNRNDAALQQGDKIYSVGVFADVTSLNFFQANGPDNTIWNAYMLPPPLQMYTLSDVYFTWIPMAAAVADPDPLQQEGDFWVVEIPLRQDITWSDGEPFTAADVAFTANTSLKFGLFAGNWGQWYDGNFLDHVEAVDDYTVKYYYHTKPGLARHEFGVLEAPILAEHYWAPVAAEAAAPIDALPADASEEELTAAQTEATENLFAHVPDGEPTAGAFQLNRWEPGAFLDTSANPDFFAQGITVENWENGAFRTSEGITVGEPQGDPSLVYEIGPFASATVYTIYGSQDAAILALKNGEVDFVLNSLGLQRGLADQIRNDPNLTVMDNSTNSFRYLSFNNRRRPMNDCAFRQAVAALIDKEFVSQTILQGAASPFYTYVSSGNQQWYFDDVPKIGQAMDRQQRLDLAIAILEQAGYSWENDEKPTFDTTGNSVVPGGRLIMPDGTPVPPLELWAPSAGYDPLRSTFAIWIESWLNEVGIPVTAQLAGFNILIPRIFSEQDFDMYILGWSLDIFPTSLRDFFSEEQAAPGGNNAGGYVNQEFEDLSVQLLQCETQEACREIADQIQLMLATETPYVVLFETGIIEAYRSDLLTYPYTEQLSGLQYTHIGGQLPGLQGLVKVE